MRFNNIKIKNVFNLFSYNVHKSQCSKPFGTIYNWLDGVLENANTRHNVTALVCTRFDVLTSQQSIIHIHAGDLSIKVN